MQLRPDLLEALFADIAATGNRDVKVEYLNLPQHIRPRMNELLSAESVDVQQAYDSSQEADYRAEMEPIIRELVDRYDLDLRFGEIVNHVENQALVEIRTKNQRLKP